jgi:bifunctional DNA-binding transcriptional regulator/antitoxin component of YhaV-PrlF toxin-antitoxin module
MLDCGTFRLTVTSDGTLSLPPLLTRQLALAPGDILFIERSPLSLHLRIYREFIAFQQEVTRPESWWAGFEEILSRTPTAIDAEGYLVIPSEVLDVRKGDLLTLQVYRHGGLHCMFLFRPRPKGYPRDLRLEPTIHYVSLK